MFTVIALTLTLTAGPSDEGKVEYCSYSEEYGRVCCVDNGRRVECWFYAPEEEAE